MSLCDSVLESSMQVMVYYYHYKKIYKTDFRTILSPFSESDGIYHMILFQHQQASCNFLEAIWHGMNSGNTAEVLWMRAGR